MMDELMAWLDSCHVKSDKNFIGYMDIAIFDITLVTYGYWWENTGS